MTFEFFGRSLWSPQQNLKTKTGQVAHILEYCHGDTIFDIGMCGFLSFFYNNNKNAPSNQALFLVAGCKGEKLNVEVSTHHKIMIYN